MSKIVIVTGGSRGIGASTALHCAQRGFGVILTYNQQSGAADDVLAAIKAHGAKAVALKLDVTDSGSFAAFRDRVRQTLESVWDRRTFDALVNNAGYGLYAPIETVTEAQFDDLFKVHLKGPFFLTQQLLPLIGDGGHIVNLTSATTRVATAGVAPYAAFKGGLEVLTRTWPRNSANAASAPTRYRRARSGPRWAAGSTPSSKPCWPRKPRWAASAKPTTSAAASPACCRTNSSGSMPSPSKSPAATTSNCCTGVRHAQCYFSIRER